MLVFDASGRDSLAVGVSGKESGRVQNDGELLLYCSFDLHRPSKRQQNDRRHSHAFGARTGFRSRLYVKDSRLNLPGYIDIQVTPQSLNIYAQICGTSNRNESLQKRSELLRTLT